MSISELWKDYNEVSRQLSFELGRTNNLVGEYAEHLVNQYIDGVLLSPSNKSADIEKDGKLYQVKSRRVDNERSITLGVIRSWDFDYLVVVIFNDEGCVRNALMIPVSIVKEIAVKNEHQHGYVLTTNKDFFNIRKYKDITYEIRVINGEDVSQTAKILPIKTRTFTKLNRIKKWSERPANINHRMIKAYLKLRSTSDVSKKDFINLCSDVSSNPKFYVEKFIQNYNSMKTDAGNSHGKIFFEDSDLVYLYPQVEAEIKQWF